MIIGIDHGNKNIKTHSGTVFTSGLLSSAVPFSLAGDTIRYNGTYYALTEERIPYMRDKTTTEQFFILTLFAIAYELSKVCYVPGSAVGIDLAVGLPPGHFGKQYWSFEQYFTRNRYIEFEFYGKQYSIYIQSTVAYPQGYAAIIPDYAKIREYPRAVILDIGGFSLDYLQLKDGKPDMAVCDSLELGLIRFYNDIRSSINSSEDILIEESDIDAVIGQKPTVFEEKIRRLIEQEAEAYTDKIINALRERMIDLKSTHAIFVGGGSLLLEKYLRTSKKIVSPDIIKNINANALGYEILLRKQLEAKGAK